MFVFRPRKMQKAQRLRGLFFLVLVLLFIDSWFVTNGYPKQLINPWIRPPLISSKLMKTRRPSGTTISYRLDSWSQYDNPEEGTKREGDLQLSKTGKTITTDETLLWPNGIVNYYVHSSIANEPMKFAVLEEALHTIMSKTCIKFVRIQEHAKLPANMSWVNVTGHRKGCFSNLGRKACGPTTLNLDVNACFRTIGHAIHEMLHILGVYHEHMRPDRDEYITIMWENIKKGDAFNFYILNNTVITDYGLPYDYDSIMHYSMTAFSTNKSLPTIIPMLSYVEIGQRSHLSYYDIQKLRIAYNCSAVDTNKLKKNEESNLKKLKRRKELPQQNKTDIKIKVKPQMPMIIIQNSISNKLDKNADLEMPMNKFNQVPFLKSIYPINSIQSNYYRVSLSPTYRYINFHIYLHKNICMRINNKTHTKK